MNNSPPVLDDQWIISLRGKKNRVDPLKPYGLLVEKECMSTGAVEDTATVFLTNSECPFHCLMCDLWKNTAEIPLSPGLIPNQIEWALKQLPVKVNHIKLYNSGSFFDQRAIPAEDYEKTASLLSGFETVIVESHPKFIDENCLRFRDLLKPELQVAIGLETANEKILQKINKRMTTDDFRNSVEFLTDNKIKSRAFILLKLPLMDEQEGIFWAKRSIDFAFDSGAECCAVIPVRSGNGAMEKLEEWGYFSPPLIRSLENVLEYGIQLRRGRVFADLWDLGKFSQCKECYDERFRRLNKMNLYQKVSGCERCNCDNA